MKNRIDADIWRDADLKVKLTKVTDTSGTL